MKKHTYFNGQNRNINKKWSDLKLKQKEYIQSKLKEQIIDFIGENHRLPSSIEKQQIVDDVYNLIEERQIWIPKKEILLYLNAKINKWTK